MTSLLGAKRRAEEFDAAVEGRMATSDLRPELAELLAVVGTLRAQQSPAPRAEFSAELRERLMAEAAISLTRDASLALPPRTHGARERRLALLASSFVLVGGSAGMAVAAQDALPGDALYPIKRALESADRGLSTSDANKGRDLLGQADSRLAEASALLDDPTGRTQVDSTLADFTSDAVEGSELLLGSYADSGDETDVRELRAFTSDSVTSLQRLAEVAPAELQDDLAVAAGALMEIDERAAAACPSCASELPALKMPDLLMVVSDVNRARRAVDGAEINNNHPLLEVQQPPRRTTGTKGEPEQPSRPGVEQPAEAPVGSGSNDPDRPGGAVDTEAPGNGEDIVKQVDEGTEGTVGELGDGVDLGSGVELGEDVEQVLPGGELGPILDTQLP